jgi:hypothetical protein
LAISIDDVVTLSDAKLKKKKNAPIALPDSTDG